MQSHSPAHARQLDASSTPIDRIARSWIIVGQEGGGSRQAKKQRIGKLRELLKRFDFTSR